MTYYLMNGILCVEKDNGRIYRYSHVENKWIDYTIEFNDAQVGFDPSEPEGSPYRYGNGSCMADITTITKEEALKYIDESILLSLVQEGHKTSK